MTGWSRSARTRYAFGRFLFLGLFLGGCQLRLASPRAPDAELAEPIVSPGPISRAEQQEAAQLYERAQSSFEGRRFLEALRLTADLLRRLPASDVSGAALLLSATAEYESGALERADAAAEEYIGLLPEGDPRAAGVRLFQAEVLDAQPAIQLDRLLRIDTLAGESEVGRALRLVRTATASLTFAELEAVAAAAPQGGAAAAPVYARLAVEFLVIRDDVAAADFARSAIDAGAFGAELELAEGVLRGELPVELRPERAFQIATVLPYGGPPALTEYAALVAEGVEVAVATVLGEEYEITLVARDDEADPARAAEIVSELEAEPVAGVIGFLLDDALLAAGEARERGLPLVSPTARSAPRAGEGAYSLEGADSRAAAAVARYAASRAFQRVAMVYPATPEATEEADAFEVVATSLGIQIVGRFPYEPGATSFEAQIEPAQDSLRAAEIAELRLTVPETLLVEMLEPVGLFMPIPAEDVEFIAAQVAHFGLDTLAIEVIGTSGWTAPQALEEVDLRLVTGVVATAPAGTGPGSVGHARFQQAYEAHFQKSLISTTPALGYDAALLLLEALRPGRLSPEDVRTSFRSLVDIEGATGIFSIVEDRVVRRTEVVRIDNGQLIPVPVG